MARSYINVKPGLPNTDSSQQQRSNKRVRQQYNMDTQSQAPNLYVGASQRAQAANSPTSCDEVHNSTAASGSLANVNKACADAAMASAAYNLDHKTFDELPILSDFDAVVSTLSFPDALPFGERDESDGMAARILPYFLLGEPLLDFDLSFDCADEEAC